ncbi:hypothetical protein [Nocardioides sp. SYSU DS0651]|uniref:hypothetical protein n=1 Tax=Nocardioides sp. SYSU DS0651 TaxID=3415955 RepID=UPI003F4BF79D
MASSSPKGLELVEEKISAVIVTLNTELTALQEVDFPAKGHIPRRSFGGGEPSPVLARHHARAHGVVVDTLKDLMTDLEDFRSAVREARALIREKDAAAEADVTRILTRTEGLDMGRWAYVDAQHQHVNDQPTDEPPVEPSEQED